MSLGGDADAVLDEAVQRSIASGIQYGIAAGNDNDDACTLACPDTRGDHGRRHLPRRLQRLVLQQGPVRGHLRPRPGHHVGMGGERHAPNCRLVVRPWPPRT